MWLYEGREFMSSMIGESYSFVYVITNSLSGKKYIGKKVFKSKRTLPALVGKKRRRIIIKESNWKEYWSSSKYVIDDIEKHGKENFTRKILYLAPDKREANYQELALQIYLNVLDAVDDNGERLYYNENIARIYYPSKKYGGERLILANKFKNLEL